MNNIQLILGDGYKVLPSLDLSNSVIVTDPPFNIGYHYKSYKDRVPEDDYYNRLAAMFMQVPSVVIHYPESLYKLAVCMNKTPERVVSWVYNSNTAKQHQESGLTDLVLSVNCG